MQPSINPTEFAESKPISMLRYFALLTYESLLVFAVLFIAGLFAFPWTQGKPSIFYTLYLIGVIFIYFAWHWHKGNTLAMQAWRVKIHTLDGQPVSWERALIRFSVAFLSIACVGLGIFWMLWDKQKRTWQDIASRTQLVHFPKK